jgi:hypothetical protein
VKLAWKADGAAKFARDPAWGTNFVPNARLGGVWYCLVQHSLETYALADGAKDWKTIVDQAAAEKRFRPSLNARGALGREDVLDLIACGDTLVAVTSFLEVFELDAKPAKSDWKRRVPREKSPRNSAIVAYDPVGKRIVVWGKRKSVSRDEIGYADVTAVLVDGEKKWRALPAGPASPHPKDVTIVDFSMLFDAALGKIVRFGGANVSILDGDKWTSVAPKGWRGAGWRAWNLAPLHDAASGETLVVDFEQGKIRRFDRKACPIVAEMPPQPDSELWTYDPAAREIVLQHAKRQFDRVRLDLGPALDGARALGPRA